MGEEHKKSMERLTKAMGDFTPHTLKTIYEHHPEIVQKIEQLDKVMVEDGALDRKTKRLIALACVATRMCEGCIYPQAKVAMNYGATKEEILETLEVCIITGGVPTWSISRKGIAQLFKEVEE